MDWNLVISHNQTRLLAIVAELFAMLRMVDTNAEPSAFTACELQRTGETRDPFASTACGRGASRSEAVRGSQFPDELSLHAPSSTFTLPRHLYCAIMLILRPCESAIRRLIIIASRGLILKPRPLRGVPTGLASFAAASLSHVPSFQLIDPLKHFDLEDFNNNPDPVAMFRLAAPFNAALAHHQAHLAAQPIKADLLLNRLRAMRIALNDLPRQARRLARWQARVKAVLAARTAFKPMRLSPFRPGYPPGYRRKELHPVDAVLKDVHYFAQQAGLPDTG